MDMMFGKSTAGLVRLMTRVWLSGVEMPEIGLAWM